MTNHTNFWLRKSEKDYTILKIRSEKGELLTLPKDINERFLKFYQTLYSSKTADPAKMKSFLANCNLPSHNEEERDEVGAEITTKDIVETFKSLKSGKTPGPDGFK